MEPSGFCSAHRDGEDLTCKTCYPISDAEYISNLEDNVEKLEGIIEQLRDTLGEYAAVGSANRHERLTEMPNDPAIEDANPMRDKAARDDLRERVMDGLASGIPKGAIRHELVLGLLDLVDGLEAGAQQTALLRGLPLPQHLEDMLARLWTWTTTYGEALCPRLRADTFGEGMREAKEQVSRMLAPYMQHPECSICRRRHGSEVQHACE